MHQARHFTLVKISIPELDRPRWRQLPGSKMCRVVVPVVANRDCECNEHERVAIGCCCTRDLQIWFLAKCLTHTACPRYHTYTKGRLNTS